MDTFEWKSGYTVKYGLCHVDFKSLKRTPKLSAKWYSKFIKGYEQIEMASEESPKHMVSYHRNTEFSRSMFVHYSVI